MNGRAYERTLKRAHPRTNEGNERKNKNWIQNVLEEFWYWTFQTYSNLVTKWKRNRNDWFKEVLKFNAGFHKFFELYICISRRIIIHSRYKCIQLSKQCFMQYLESDTS